LPMIGLRRLESGFRARFRAANPGGTDRDTIFVSLAPDASPRIYEGNWAWDVGFLSLSAERLSYWGEDVKFALKREEVVAVELGPGPTNWFSTPALYITWRDLSGSSGTLNLRPLGGGSMIQMRSDTRQLANDLRRWHAGRPLDEDSLLKPGAEWAGAGGTPKIGQVTSVAPRILVSGAMLTRDFLLNTFLGVVVIVLFGLGFPMIDDLFLADSAPNAHPSYAGIYVLGAIWLLRLFLLLPFFRAPKESQPPQTASVPASTS